MGRECVSHGKIFLRVRQIYAVDFLFVLLLVGHATHRQELPERAVGYFGRRNSDVELEFGFGKFESLARFH